MSADFSIKPIGTPVAAPVVQLASAAANDTVATELPPSQSVTAADISTRSRNDLQTSREALSRQVVVDRDAAAVVYQVVDRRTSLVVKQFPEEAMLRRRAYFRTLDLMNAERDPPAATDRRA
ncbi:conserved hypothetical protein [Nitrobacter winogradskyi Nb-255]|uniref:Flagellar protein FlaG n=1 Tax=Nitrobacter winogradskyi (strain ATCC 25391 / DSM 10237 / CIP 104748 / NCIMB 11846 / Nb-255) TaxID=323098 RepID=Q3STM1_NITWN|nr:hypothetical protein [Nitrobacter winogradskyi]ABA04370.1 conserved hypothetical protein [Nitrobacter winogradskyi Nb-255]